MARFDRANIRYSDIHKPKLTYETTNVRRFVSPELTLQGSIAIY
jgi:hypothetical protein